MKSLTEHDLEGENSKICMIRRKLVVENKNEPKLLLKRAERNTLHGCLFQKIKRKPHCGCVLQKIKRTALRMRIPENKEKTSLRMRTPENKEKTAARLRTLKNKEKNALWMRTPENKEKTAARLHTQENKEKSAVRSQNPENQEKTAKRMRQPKIKEKNEERMQKKLNEKRDNLNKNFECLDEIDTDTDVPIIKPNIIESFRNAQTYLHRTMVDGKRNIHKGLVCVVCDGQITGTDPVCYLDKEQIDKYRKIFSVQSYNECFGGEINPVLLSKAV